jgi:CheY-like chemotaxis protein
MEGHLAHRRRTSRPKPGSAHVLVVEDMEDLRIALTELLSAYGLEVRAANDGAHALRAMRRSSPRLVLTDLGMPVMDGVQLIRAMRVDRALEAIPVIAMSAAPRPAALPRDVPFVRKPVSVEQLLAVITGCAGDLPALATTG